MQCSMRPSVGCVAFVAAFAIACSDNVGGPPIADGGTGIADGGPGIDGGLGANDGGSGGIDGGSGGIDGGSGGIDGGPVGNDGGASGVDGGSVVEDAGPPCPAYQSLCDGGCIPTSVDPMNCGGCGHTCQTGMVCSGGGCAMNCLTGLSPCNQSCVDTASDNLHCGGCNHPCPSGTGCSDGTCEPAVNVNPGGASCTDTGPPIIVGGFADGGTQCGGNVAQVTFRWALCSCQTIQMSSILTTDAYDSTRGPYTPGGLGGSIGVNVRFANSAESEVWGSLWSAGPEVLNSDNATDVRQELHLAGGLQSSATYAVGLDAFINGNVSTSDAITIGGALHVPPDAGVGGGVRYGSLVRGPVTVDPPCDCSRNLLIPVANIVDYHRTHNDNASIGLDPAALDGPANAARLDLPCGRYSLTRISSSAPITVVAHGRTALFLDEITMSAPITITLDPTAEFDIFIAQTIHTSDALTIGSPNYPALLRVYLGSTQGFDVSSGATIAGNFYAAYGPVTTSARFEEFGSLFAGDFHASDEVLIHYDREVLAAGAACPPAGGGSDGGAPDGGVADGGLADGGTSDGGVAADAGPPCTSCRDCGNQACVNGTCGKCTTNSDCCAPLFCTSIGVCGPG
jgi:hypothetical protein